MLFLKIVKFQFFFLCLEYFFIFIKDYMPAISMFYGIIIRTGTLSPMKQVNPADLHVRGFKWYNDKRPKSKIQLLGDLICTMSYALFIYQCLINGENLVDIVN